VELPLLNIPIVPRAGGGCYNPRAMTDSQGLLTTAAIVAIVLTILSVAAALSWALRAASGRTPYYRRDLETTYASFRPFLMTVQAVVVRRLQE
jgi:hypothetical protein